MSIRIINRRDCQVAKCYLERGDTLKLSIDDGINKVYLEDKVTDSKKESDTVAVFDLVNVPGFEGTCRVIAYGKADPA